LKDRTGVEITLPDYGKVKVDVPRAGAFYLVREKTAAVTRIAAAD